MPERIGQALVLTSMIQHHSNRGRRFFRHCLDRLHQQLAVRMLQAGILAGDEDQRRFFLIGRRNRAAADLQVYRQAGDYCIVIRHRIFQNRSDIRIHN